MTTLKEYLTIEELQKYYDKCQMQDQAQRKLALREAFSGLTEINSQKLQAALSQAFHTLPKEELEALLVYSNLTEFQRQQLRHWLELKEPSEQKDLEFIPWDPYTAAKFHKDPVIRREFTEQWLSYERERRLELRKELAETQRRQKEQQKEAQELFLKLQEEARTKIALLKKKQLERERAQSKPVVTWDKSSTKNQRWQQRAAKVQELSRPPKPKRGSTKLLLADLIKKEDELSPLLQWAKGAISKAQAKKKK